MYFSNFKRKRTEKNICNFLMVKSDTRWWWWCNGGSRNEEIRDGKSAYLNEINIITQQMNESNRGRLMFKQAIRGHQHKKTIKTAALLSELCKYKVTNSLLKWRRQPIKDKSPVHAFKSPLQVLRCGATQINVPPSSHSRSSLSAVTRTHALLFQV